MGALDWVLLVAVIILIPTTIYVYIKYWKFNRYGGKFKDSFPEP